MISTYFLLTLLVSSAAIDTECAAGDEVSLLQIVRPDGKEGKYESLSLSLDDSASVETHLTDLIAAWIGEFYKPGDARRITQDARQIARELLDTPTASNQMLMEWPSWSNAKDLLMAGSKAPEQVAFADRMGDRALVSQGPLELAVGPVKLQGAQVATYLDVKNPMWGKKNTLEDVVDHGKSGLSVQIVFVKKFPSLMPVAALKKSLMMYFEPTIKKHDIPKEAIDKIWDIALSEGLPKVGTKIGLESDGKSVAVAIDGKEKGRVDPSLLKMDEASFDRVSKGYLQLIFGDDGPLSGLAHSFFERLQTAPPF